MTVRSTLRRALVAAGALTVALGLAAPTAVADPTAFEEPTSTNSSATPTPVPLPDPDAKVNLHIVKHESPATSLPADGMAQDGIANPVIEGVEFTIRRHPTIELDTRTGWDDAQRQSVADFPWSEGLHPDARITDANGQVSFLDLPMGLWMVQETKTPPGVVPAAPFLVTLPMTDPITREDWMYDVFVYPKNAMVTVGKTVSDGHTVNDQIEWTIRADIPQLPDEKIDLFRIVDAIDPRLMVRAQEYQGQAVRVMLEQGDSASTIAPELFDLDHTDKAPGDRGGTLAIEFNAAGREFLDAAPAGSRVVVHIKTVVVEMGNGEFRNFASFYPDTKSQFNSSPAESNTAESRYGGIRFLKADNLDRDKVLEGAVFQVYTSREAALAGGEDYLRIGINDTWRSDENGLVTISGLRLSNWANGQQVAPGDEGWTSYWLVEVGAPEGYELLAEPIEFPVLTPGEPTIVAFTVENIPHNAGFRLPMTGGAGTTALTVGGLALAGAALAVKVAHSRRQAA
ncbi:MAG: SpaH/EbpB family LPXTG-anchored major pilin [Promicromonosporaceae bacterium]|nr:SpaH/EbpB family LPXTG-anchored major pilin [Promicromonosporaceae bacterium]